MDRKIRFRTFFLAGVVFLAGCLLIPSLVPSTSVPRWFGQVFNKKIQMGLDLQGGLYIVYSIDLDQAVDSRAASIRRDIEATMAESGIEGRVSNPRAPLGLVTITLNDPAERSRINAEFLSGYAETVDVLEECPPEQAEATVCLQVSERYAEEIRKSAQQQAVLTIRDRINERGVAEPSVKTKGSQIVVELPGLDSEEVNRVKELIARTAKLEFKIVDENNAFMQSVYRHVESDPRAKELGITVGEDFWAHDESGKSFTDFYLRAEDDARSVTVAEAKERGCWSVNLPETDGHVECSITGRQIIADYLAELGQNDPEMAIDGDHQYGYEYVQPEAIGEADKRDPFWRTYYLFRTAELEGDSVADAYKFWDPTTNRPAVLIIFDRNGGRRFGEMTSKNVGKKMAIILDNRVNSAPVIQDAITGGRSTITMGGRSNAEIDREADDLVSVLKTGSLQAPLQEETSTQMGPLLGNDAIEKAEISFAVGSLLVLIIMVLVYRVAGWISMFALVLNVGLMMSVLSLLGATLTLPGIAALVLTVGMAVDANIIIYERIREELRAGKSIRGAVDAGFNHGFSAILDGQMTTAVAGYVLLQYGSGPIRGFAVMLIIGIACTLFTATWCTRLFFEYYVGKGRKVTQIAI